MVTFTYKKNFAELKLKAKNKKRSYYYLKFSKIVNLNKFLSFSPYILN